MHATFRPMLYVVVQGAKVIMLGQRVFDYDANRMLMSSVDLPVVGEVRRESAADPYLCFRLDLDPSWICRARIACVPTRCADAR